MVTGIKYMYKNNINGNENNNVVFSLLIMNENFSLCLSLFQTGMALTYDPTAMQNG